MATSQPPKGEKRWKPPKPSSSAPSPAEDGKVRPEDVVFHDVDTLGGIIITGTRKPKGKKPGPGLDG